MAHGPLVLVYYFIGNNILILEFFHHLLQVGQIFFLVSLAKDSRNIS